VCDFLWQSGFVTRLLRVLLVSYVGIIWRIIHTHCHFNAYFIRKGSGQNIGTCNKAMLFQLLGSSGYGNAFSADLLSFTNGIRTNFP
jgi:hypothetical protein